MIQAFAVAGMLLIVGGFGTIAHQPWIFPSLGASVFIEATAVYDRSPIRSYDTIFGHLAGALAGSLAVIVFGLAQVPASWSDGGLSWPRLAAAALAMALTVVIARIVRASHPPALSTTLIFALGGFSVSVHSFVSVLIAASGLAASGALYRAVCCRLRPESPVVEIAARSEEHAASLR